MQFPRGIRVNSPVLGLYWWLLIYLITCLPVDALPAQLDYALPSEPYHFETERPLSRRDSADLKNWDIYQKYKNRGKKAPEESISAKFVSSTIQASRKAVPNDPTSQIYTYNGRSLKVKNVVLGEGGDGIVYRGTLDDMPVAVKLSPDLSLAQAGAYMDDLKDSPYVIDQLGLFRAENFQTAKDRSREPKIFQVTPLMDSSLVDWIVKAKDGDYQQYHKSIAQQMLQGLVDMHKKGLAHRDFKPDNVFIRKQDGKMQAFVADLDRATDLVDTFSTGAGTQGYTPLEYMLGPSYDSKKGDVFAAAISVMVMLFSTQVQVRHPPLGWIRALWKAILDAQNPKWPNFRKETFAERIQRKVLLHDDFADLLPGMTKDMANVLSKALCPQKERFTAQEFMDELLPLLPFEPCG
ncbi:hypothetical protein N7492_004571 [Penicillium capsulatum]|uniref:Protein kinase domain-containing protein n=1 Tax=Penicillium capsulatum TaxID=69766 RepID=A0A9W9IA91_9EURO|nr:hypothetical protein N7492_004571 [Penicillium capsulatum]KAJ6136311.1 hypothetical protein N7512_001471 [Penicillium capsulatum]